MTQVTLTDWDAFVARQPNVHIFQTGVWGEFKSRFGWEAYRFQNGKCAAQLLIRTLPLGFHLAYIPKGPVGKDWQTFWPEIHHFCRTRECFMVKVEPDLMDSELKQPSVHLPGFIKSHAIQPQRTIILDLDINEDMILERMKQKTRYNIRLAIKKGVKVYPSQDIGLFYKIMQKTGDRNQFGIHNEQYYENVYEVFSKLEKCQLLIAEYQNEPLAAIMVFRYGQRAWYFYGASTDIERERMPTYLLQWEAIRWAKRKGCREYDLWGVPDEDKEILEKDFVNRADSLWGVYRFKRGFGGRLVRSVGAWDYVYSSVKYWIFLMMNKLRKTQPG